MSTTAAEIREWRASSVTKEWFRMLDQEAKRLALQNGAGGSLMQDATTTIQRYAEQAGMVRGLNMAGTLTFPQEGEGQ